MSTVMSQQVSVNAKILFIISVEYYTQEREVKHETFYVLSESYNRAKDALLRGLVYEDNDGLTLKASIKKIVDAFITTDCGSCAFDLSEYAY